MSNGLPRLTWRGCLWAVLLACTGCKEAARLGRGLLTGEFPTAETRQPPLHGPSGEQPDAGLRASELVAQSRRAVLGHRSITARVRLGTSAWGTGLRGTGTYLQGPASSGCVRLELVFRTEGGVFSWQQVADGNYLWTHRRFGEESVLERARIAPSAADVRAAVGEGPSVAESGRVKGRDGAAAAADESGVRAIPASLAGLLSSLERYWEFTDLQAVSLAGRPMWLIQGTPRAPAWQALFARVRREAEAWQSARRLAILPGNLRLWLDRNDLFPYRIVLEQAASSAGNLGTGRPVMLDLEFYDVELDRPLPAHLFKYDPGATPFVDTTDRYHLTR